MGHAVKALMKVAPGAGNLELVDIKEPACDDNHVKLEVKYSGICGTDIHVMHGSFTSYPPVILGHEFSGIVTEVGKNCKHTRLGDRVAVLGSTMVQCGRCEHCTEGNYMFCAVRRGMGHGVNGSFTKYVVVREDMVYHLPQRLSLEEGALAEAFASAVQAVEELTSFHAGETVLVSGPGPIGLMSMQLVVAHGCKVIVSGSGEDAVRLELAKQLGADVVVDVTKQDLSQVVYEQTQGNGVDTVVECSGAGAAISQGLAVVKKRGKFIQVGITGKEISLNFDQVLFKQLQVFGSLGHSLKTWQRVMRIFNHGKISLTPLITHKLPLSKWKEAFAICESKQGVKVLLSYDEQGGEHAA